MGREGRKGKGKERLGGLFFLSFLFLIFVLFNIILIFLKNISIFCCDTLLDQEEHRCCGHLPHCFTFARNSQNILLFLSTNLTELWSEIHHIPHPSLSCNSSLPSPNLHLSTSAPSFKLPSSSFLHDLSLRSCTSVFHCQCFAHLPLLFTSV